MDLTTADGTRYVIERFSQWKGAAEAYLTVPGIVYPESCEWHGCTLVLGERTFPNVKAGITDIDIDNPRDGVEQPSTRYRAILTWRSSPTPDDTQEAPAVRKPLR